MLPSVVQAGHIDFTTGAKHSYTFNKIKPFPLGEASLYYFNTNKLMWKQKSMYGDRVIMTSG